MARGMPSRDSATCALMGPRLDRLQLSARENTETGGSTLDEVRKRWPRAVGMAGGEGGLTNRTAIDASTCCRPEAGRGLSAKRRDGQGLSVHGCMQLVQEIWPTEGPAGGEELPL